MPQQISIRGVSYAVEPEPHAKFWKQVAGNAWEPETFEIFDRFITDKTLFLDIGAWIGSTALYGAQRAKRCVAFEPDPVAFQELKRNVAANSGAAWAKKSGNQRMCRQQGWQILFPRRIGRRRDIDVQRALCPA